MNTEKNTAANTDNERTWILVLRLPQLDGDNLRRILHNRRTSFTGDSATRQFRQDATRTAKKLIRETMAEKGLTDTVGVSGKNIYRKSDAGHWIEIGRWELHVKED